MRTAILMSNAVPQELRERIQAGLAPRYDFLLLAERLGARLITPAQGSWGKFGKFSRI